MRRGWLFSVGKGLLVFWLLLVHVAAAMTVALWRTVSDFGQLVEYAGMQEWEVWISAAIVCGPTALLYFALWGWRELFGMAPRGG